MQRYNKLLGQHFIYDREVLDKIIDAATSVKGKHIFEIGAGSGTLSAAILLREPASLISVEKDKRFSESLSSLMAQYQNYKYTIGDALLIRLSSLFKQEKVTIIANLPYNIATHLLLGWMNELEQVREMVLMFQKEVADRICAQPKSKNYGALSVLVQLECKAESQFALAPEVFTPPPRVTSTVLKLTPLKNKWPRNKPVLEKILTEGFSQRRKMIKKSLSRIFKDSEALHSALAQVGASPTMRIEELNPEQLCRLSCIAEMD
ncbi:16S rRNA (adenine(1518)-N(6)/adenine(1519)-N(6))-dimethyltransferase RsmA [Neorickettsia sennetsu]|uniref:Ribosomal RNA small subunit methyltransferase A n=1 Tax=Ehrlichia sennetsu (strain ATCC VR-367 / Miyayama) TaxID=222891 RepID=RSMA_EHRS3|nr:16S rRNA (adenine(1518)-N(6)/adenine(1519)-N(6))-dimethyltransferase RsmA [Neorickettsia sennetsu]Q2GE45.1 RecName: Full=Ribosomal RNA small subunit methyltransferase A; AltName: Full=16S rRNA (adenine(1518)-N(6)/adenine(1519)-N(6))-dimethyltransferase; AltName: Full=16S rRNA dimethyladenosine transferase; AltName: Full=16S rRNA dimethylase; AltName: Full=S-adenosylmethionine-6-N', N'-adenosyl(rRNA) dimethyltransferase [Neorickettsia sennetsu str. Miyayama]ABD46348.1 dimethyladenosine transfer